MADPLATSADYADALLVARRGRNVLFLITLLMLLLQIAVFFIARYTNVIPTTTNSVVTTQPAASELLNWVTSGTTTLGTILPILLALVLLLIVHIMLVGRLIGVARVTSAFLWCLVLMLLLFPWQKFFGVTTDPRDMRLPGVLYTWDELVMYARFPTENLHLAITKWARFFVLPMLAVILLFVVQIKSSRGLRQALGEADPQLHNTPA
jgi:hypothetical protein